MAIYSVYVPPGGPLPLDSAGRIKAGDRAVFLPDKFSYAAFAFGPFWLLWSRLWLPLAAYALAAMLIVTAVRFLGLSPFAILMLVGLMDWFLGLEGARMIGARLERQRFKLADVIAGSKMDDVEQRFFSRWLTGLDEVAAARSSSAVAPVAGG